MAVHHVPPSSYSPPPAAAEQISTPRAVHAATPEVALTGLVLPAPLVAPPAAETVARVTSPADGEPQGPHGCPVV